mgnify:CR=1 FL=1
MKKPSKTARTFLPAVRRSGAYTKTSSAHSRRLRGVCRTILASLLIAWQPLQLRLLADHQTRLDPKIVTLKSGDLATLDAATALRDATDLEERRVSLLSGTGYFNVNSTGRRFIVSADGITAEAIGTEFEVSHVGDDVIVTVAEGIVDVSRDNKMTRLSEGQQLRVSTNDMLIRRLDSDEVAVWRADRLSLEGLTFAEAALIVGRRLPGRVIVLGSALQNTEVAGVLDLSEPDSALDTLAASSSAGVLRASTLLTILYAR